MQNTTEHKAETSGVVGGDVGHPQFTEGRAESYGRGLDTRLVISLENVRIACLSNVPWRGEQCSRLAVRK